MTNLSKIFYFCLLCVLLISCDQGTKTLAKQHLKDSEPISYLNNMVRLEYVENTGAFLSMGENWPKPFSFLVFILLPILVLVAIFLYTLKNHRAMSLAQMLPFALIFSGGVGNIIDRILYDRHVTDFLNVGFGDVRTGIFNVADMYVTTALIMLVIYRLRKPKTASVYDSNN